MFKVLYIIMQNKVYYEFVIILYARKMTAKNCSGKSFWESFGESLAIAIAKVRKFYTLRMNDSENICTSFRL